MIKIFKVRFIILFTMFNTISRTSFNTLKSISKLQTHQFYKNKAPKLIIGTSLGLFLYFNIPKQVRNIDDQEIQKVKK